MLNLNLNQRRVLQALQLTSHVEVKHVHIWSIEVLYMYYYYVAAHQNVCWQEVLACKKTYLISDNYTDR